DIPLGHQAAYRDGDRGDRDAEACSYLAHRTAGAVPHGVDGVHLGHRQVFDLVNMQSLLLDLQYDVECIDKQVVEYPLLCHAIHSITAQAFCLTIKVYAIHRSVQVHPKRSLRRRASGRADVSETTFSTLRT